MYCRSSSRPAPYPFAKAVRFFPPLVSGVVITVVRLALIGVGVNLVVGNDPKAAGHAAPSRLALAAFVILVILLVARFGRGFLAQTGVLLGLLAGTAVAVPLGLADFSAARAADWIGLCAPFHFGAPEFPAVAVLSMCVVMLVLFAESTADLIAVAELTGRRLTTADMARGLAKLGAWVAGLPQPVVGAAELGMSATVAADGVSTLREVDFDGTHNLLIVAVSIGVGMAPEMAPALYSRVPEGIGIVLGSPVTSATLLAFCLNLAFNGGNSRRDAGLVRAPAAEGKREAPAGRTRV
ncbi:solute carrier family 23 protein [Streptomyces achromogenes]|uniref:uracil-xanthine permease family protein n=1 Tax=Streptomyces achromogenes TaxID=67255 RepID=UPI0034002E06